MRRLHPQEAVVTTARLELTETVLNWRRTHNDLTENELLSIIRGVLGDQITSLAAKYMTRYKRHPDNPDKPGGLE